MAKNLKYGALLGIYGSLLTAKQYDILESYYDDDLSLGEIAENLDISRQGVRDFIKRGEAQLDEYEQKLRLLENQEKLAIIRNGAEMFKRQGGGTFADAMLAAIDFMENGSNK
ncbi:MAG: sigma factor-like helix-turn-helix DNA-binding protein [Clostridia bacterium]|nr:sigma factor-like helix-turn-helix DNA-binding protein [Clostridia bacterium]